MDVTVSTFNLNKLFSRWNFRGAIKAIGEGGDGSDHDPVWIGLDL